MRQTRVLAALAIFGVMGIVHHSTSLAEAWQGSAITHLNGKMANAVSVSDEQKPLIHKVGDGYSGMSSPNMTPQAMPSPQNPAVGSQPRSTGDYKSGSLSNEGRYGSTSDNYMKKESSGSSTGPYGSSVYGGPPATPSADPMIKELNRDPSMR